MKPKPDPGCEAGVAQLTPPATPPDLTARPLLLARRATAMPAATPACPAAPIVGLCVALSIWDIFTLGGRGVPPSRHSDPS